MIKNIVNIYVVLLFLFSNNSMANSLEEEIYVELINNENVTTVHLFVPRIYDGTLIDTVTTVLNLKEIKLSQINDLEENVCDEFVVASIWFESGIEDSLFFSFKYKLLGAGETENLPRAFTLPLKNIRKKVISSNRTYTENKCGWVGN